MMRRLVLNALLGFAVLGLAACSGDASGEGDLEAVAGRIVSEGSLGPVSASLHMAPEAPRFGDRVRFRLEVKYGADATLEALSLPVRFGHWRLRSRRGPEEAEAGVRRYLAEGEAERTGLNIGRIPPIAFSVKAGEGEGEAHLLQLPPFEVEVEGLAAEAVPQLAELREPLAPLPLPPPERSTLLLWILSGALVLLVVGSALFVKLRRDRVAAPPPPIDPELEAQEALDALQASGLLAAGEFGEFYLRLTGIVRRFIERTTEVHAPELTTEEFLREMERRRLFGREKERDLQRFLEAADMVKFAAQVPDASETAAAVDAARGFCRRERVAA